MSKATESCSTPAFDASADTWTFVLSKGVTRLTFKPIRTHWGETHADNAKRAARAYLETHAPDTVANAVGFLGRMARHVPLRGSICSAALMNYRARLSAEQLHYLGHIASFLKFWHARGYPGVDAGVLEFFRRVRIPGNVKGTAVRTHDPVKGPFTDPELQAIVLAARESHRCGLVSRQDYAVLLTLTATGARSGQVSMLVCGDMIPPVRGSSFATRLRVPSLKKRTRERLTRERVIPAELAVVLGELIDQRRIDGRFTGTVLSRRPIFARTSESFESPERAHIGSDGVAYAVKRVQKALRLRSARTGLLMNLSPRRFRRTLGTRAADAGHSPFVIADLLDHSDLQHVGVYVQAGGSIQDRIDAALADCAEPLVGLFTGAVVAGEAQSGVADAASRRVAAAGRAVGTCAGPLDCNRVAPLACYTCAAFRPWRDAPHGALLRSLAEEREALIADGIAPQVAGANDATIMAVDEVAERCRALCAGDAHG